MSGGGVGAPAAGAVHDGRAPGRVAGVRWWVVATVARTDLRQLVRSRDYWLPMALLGTLFFLVIPGVLLLVVTRVDDAGAVEQLATSLEVLPERAQEAIRGDTPAARAAYALAVYLLAPVAVVVPLTVSTAVGAATIVGERERGTGEFLAHSPASVREIYLGKLAASLAPGLLTLACGFGAYSLLVNLVVGPEVGGWFFPTAQWWVLVLWVVPPFLGLTLSLVLRLSARVRSTIAAQQASGLVSLPMIVLAYAQSSGSLALGGGVGVAAGALAWLGAAWALAGGIRSVTRGRLLGVADEA